MQDAKNLNAGTFDAAINRERSVRDGVTPPLLLVRRAEGGVGLDQIERVFNATLRSLRRRRVSLRDPRELVEVLAPCAELFRAG